MASDGVKQRDILHEVFFSRPILVEIDVCCFPLGQTLIK
jgi:hypothetical protein